MHDVVVIGAGASGVFFSLVLKSLNSFADILILEKNDKLGKKLLMTGNGRCNLGNKENLLENYYSSSSLSAFKDKLEVKDYGFLDILPSDLENYYEYLNAFGILIRKEDNSSRLYPYSNQALTVCKSFERALNEKGVKVKYNYDVKKVEKENDIFIINDEIKCKKLVVATGGVSYPKTGSTGFGHEILKSFNHTITKLYPSLTYLNTDYKYIKELAGVRFDSYVSLSVDGFIEKSEKGQVQFTKDSLSGIVVFNLSRNVSKYLDEGKKVKLILNLVTNYSGFELKDYLKGFYSYKVEDALSTIVNNKLALVVAKELNVSGLIIKQLKENELEGLCFNLQNMYFNIVGVGGFDAAQITNGGALLSEFTNGLESKKTCGLYAIGEVLDVDGRCGGYNLSWAFTSALEAVKDLSNKIN